MQRILLHIFFALLVLISPVVVLAQPGDIEVTGTVIDASNRESLPSVIVQLKGTGRVVSTDLDGKYKIKVPSGSVLVFRYTGYKPQEVAVNRNVINVNLKSDAVTEEVIITGRRAAAATPEIGSRPTLSAEIVKSVPTADFTTSIAGRAPGVQVQQSSGVPGSPTTIRVRGQGSISAGSDPLFVIDGVPVTSGSGGDGGGSIGSSGSLGFQTSALADINSADIEKIEILKDAAATAQYGARGANGVVLVTTKRGKAGKTRFNANYYRGATNLVNRVDLLNGPQYLQVLGDAYENSFYSNRANRDNQRNLPSLDNWVTFPRTNAFNGALAQQTNTDWMDILLNENAPMQELSISGSGGSDRTTFYMGASIFNQEGLMTGNSFNRFGGRFNLDNKATDKLQLGVSTAITYTVNNLVPSGASLSGQGGFGIAQTRSLPIYPVYFPSELPGSGVQPYNQFPFNPYFLPYNGTNIALTSNTNYAYRTQEVFRNLTNFYLDYRLAERLKFRLEPGFDFRNQVDRGYESRYLRLSELGLQQPTASASDNRVMTLNYNINAYFNYVKYFGPDVKSTTNVGTSYQRTDFYNNGVTSERLPNDETTLVSAGARQVSRSGNQTGFGFLAYYANTTVDIGSQWQVLGSLRYEGSSRFGNNGRFGLFSGAGVNYYLNELEYFKKLQWLSILKLKASYGRTGNASSLDNFQSYGLYGTGATYNLLPGTRPRRTANPDLTWEKTDQLDLGVDVSFFQERIALGATYFNKVSKDMLLGLPASPSLGIEDGTILRNVGRMRNSGWEFTLSTRNIDLRNDGEGKPRKLPISWTTDFNITFYDNEVLDLGGLRPNEVSGSPDYNTYVGGQVATFFLPYWAGVDPDNGNELIYRAERDANGQLTGRITNEKFRPTTVGQLDSNRVPHYDKPVQPKWFGGINNSIRIGGFEFSALVTFQYGNYILDQGERRQSYVTGQTNLRASLLDAWQQPGDVTNVPILYYSNAPGIFSSGDVVTRGPFNDDPYRNRNTTRFLHDASYARLKTVSIAYNFPKRWAQSIKMESVRVYMNANNLLTWTKFPGWDPEVVGNLQSNQERNLQQGRTDLDFPQVKTVVGGINVTF